MTISPAWRSRWWIWALPLLFVLANAALFVVHPGRTGAGFADMEKELESESQALAAMTEKERAAQEVLAAARASRGALDELYHDRFSTEAERLTQLIGEVKRLAQRAGLEPASISYPEETIDEYGLVRMSLVFGVEGTYQELRTLVNLIELSDLFLVLERVGMRDSAAAGVGTSLQVSTFFVREPDDGADVEPLSERASAKRSSATANDEEPAPGGPRS
jgi:hypothetical protein